MKNTIKLFVLCLLLSVASASAAAVSYGAFVAGYNADAVKSKDTTQSRLWPSVKRFGTGSDQSVEARFPKVLTSVMLQLENGNVVGVHILGKTKNHAGLMRIVNHAIAGYIPDFTAKEKAEAIKRAKLYDKTLIKEAQGGVNGFNQVIEYNGYSFMTGTGAEYGDIGISFWKK